ncbi:unnamed protein product [Trifolium pratense]|uniref:Uncharacterized protein n=1 Tax=Trifolium pratense TaxID=57577 RepID=A0ACB0K484_TRIPR|nr:unnamed protein product [Trifolium pratense]
MISISKFPVSASYRLKPPRLPTFHASALGRWHAVIAYDACAHLCLHAWAMQCMEAPMLLENECSLLRDAFGLRQVLLQPEEKLLVKCNAELSSEGVAPKPKNLIGKMKVQGNTLKSMETSTNIGRPSKSMSNQIRLSPNKLNLKMSSQIGRHAFDAWNDWYSVHKLQCNNVSVTSDPDLLRWVKPSPGWVKCNVAVAFVTDSGKTSMGLCFRNSNGQFMAGVTQWQQSVISTLEGETWALLLAMKEANHRGFNQVQFESDSNVLVDVIHMRHRGNYEFFSIVQDIVIFMSSFLNFEVKFVRRQANSVAHTLARATNSWASFHRFEIIPLCIKHLIVIEMH